MNVIDLLIHSFNKYILNADFMLGIVLAVGCSILNKTYEEFLPSWTFHSGFPDRGTWSRRDSPELSEHSPMGITNGNFTLPRARAARQAVSVLDNGIRSRGKLGTLSRNPSVIGGHNPVCERFVHLATGCSLGEMTVAGKAGLRQRPRLTVECR